jgi:transcriptional regulator with XRE-family HTH domain
MALSGDEKALRRELLGIAVYTLRKRLQITQAQLAAMLDDDATTVSRWERKVLAPQPRKLKLLARIARKKEWPDLAAVFAEPIEQWKSIVLSPKDRQLLALFEIWLLNKRGYRRDVFHTIPVRETIRLMRALDLMVHALKRVARIGDPVAIIGPEQAAAWSALTNPSAKALFEKGLHPDVRGVIKYTDGRIEIVRHSNGKKAQK